MEATIGYGLAIHNAGHRADPSNVDALPVKFVALAINALDCNADGRKGLNHPRFRVRAKVVVVHGFTVSAFICAIVSPVGQNLIDRIAMLG
jgi:hypothetical protein